MCINVDIKEHILHKSEIFNIYLVRNDPVYIQSKCYYYSFALVLIFIDMSLSENRDTDALFRIRFCLLGKVVVDICVRYFEASLTLVADTTVEPPKIVRAMTPRLYIPPVCWVVLQKGLCPPNSLSLDITLREKFSFLLSCIRFINLTCEL